MRMRICRRCGVYAPLESSVCECCNAEIREFALEVEDAGRGFDPESSGARAGLGLTSLAERIRLVHGRLSVRSEPGQGTRIVAWAPTGLRA